ncbi:MAG: hypothetical protein HYW25_00580 [Candidatus Aenigmarchaeota archaeon]|nr:hypothetical protein [Candidatus Aenigmarchaeota archaeon]
MSTTTREERIARVKSLIERGMNAEEMHAQTGIPIKTLYRFRIDGAPLPRKRHFRAKRKPGIDILLDHWEELRPEDLSLHSLAEAGGYQTPQGAWDYLSRTVRLGLWNDRKERLEAARKEARLKLLRVLTNPGEKIAALLTGKVLRDAEGQGALHRKAIEYLMNRKRISRNVPPENVLRFVEAYEEAERNGEKPGIQPLAERSGIRSYGTGRFILRRIGREPLNGYGIPGEKAQALERAYDLLDFSSQDLEYYTGISRNSILYFFRKIREKTGKRRKSRKSITQFVGVSGNTLCYRHASEIYRAWDAGFRRYDEISELAGRDVRVVRFAVENRRKGLDIESLIVNALGVLYPGRGTDKPYPGSWLSQTGLQKPISSR